MTYTQPTILTPYTYSRIAEPPKPRIPNILTAKELSKKVFPKAKWLIHNLFECGTMNMLSAAPNNYKSWLTLEIAMSVATATPLFDFFVVNDQQNVWIINEEDSEYDLKERFEILNKEWPDMPILFSVQNQIKLDDETVSQIIFIAKQKNIEFIILDSLRSIHEAEENSSTEMQKIMNQIKKIANSGITVLFTHHNRKKSKDSYKGSDSEDSRGSTAINAAVHSHISCEPKKEDDKNYLVIRQPKLKGAKKLEPFRLLIDLENKEDSSFKYEGESIATTSHSRMVEKIIKLLDNETGSGINLKGFVSARIGGERTLRETLKEMEDMKSIVGKLWKEVEEEELPVATRGTAHNEKFYFLPTTTKEASK